MAGWPAAVAVIARNAMWMEARVGSANGSGRDNDPDTTSRAGAGILTLAGVPIGRAEDAPPRLAAELATADVVAAEDTRRVRQLAATLDVTIAGRVISYYDVIETRRAEQLAAELAAGKNVLVVTDAGMPGISDPGYRVVAAAVAAGIRVTAVPGPSAVTTALAVSGLPTDRFCFEGFPPRKPGERARRFAELAAEPRTQVFFESPRRVAVTLAELQGSHGDDRAAVVCRELTKTHEEIVRGSLAELAAWAEGREQESGGVRGEITLVVAGVGQAVAKAAARDSAREARRAARFAARAVAVRAGGDGGRAAPHDLGEGGVPG
jgi:16S rRNA (cytidine1402-2'-O)-methyltransferase